MFLYLYSPYNPPHSFQQASRQPLSANAWVHLEAFYKNRSDATGQIIVWQNGVEIFNLGDVRTSLGGGDGNVIWGVGSYTDHIVGGPNDGEATIYIDDAVVSTLPTHTAIPEPSTVLLLFCGGAVSLVARRRNVKASLPVATAKSLPRF